MNANNSRMKMGEFTIDNHKYQCGTWDVDTATDTLTTLTKLLGESLVMVLMGAVETAKENRKEGEPGGLQGLMNMDVEKIKTDVIAKAFQGLSTRLNHAEVKQILHLCSDQLLCDGKRVDYNTHFMGRIGHLLKVTVQVLRHQYRDFLGGNPVAGS